MSTTTKCYICRYTEVEKKKGEWRTACERCEALLKAPSCKACGQPVRDGKRGDLNAYHDDCRRCSSCHSLIAKNNMKSLAGKILCTPCDQLFGEFFVPGRKKSEEYMAEAFKSWDKDNSGWIDMSELARVLKAIMPNFSEKDLTDLMRVIDKNGNGVVEVDEFCSWISQENPLDFSDSTFSDYVSKLMREAGHARERSALSVDEVQVRTDGVYFKLMSGTIRLETSAFRARSLELTALDPEEFISRVECTKAGLIISTNTGRTATLAGSGPPFGPYSAPPGFHIEGFRTKALDEPDESGATDKVCGVDLAPLPSAAFYDAPTALMFCAEQEFLESVRQILSKAGLDVNAFGPGGVTALMLAASLGNTGSMRMLLTSKANPNLADEDGWTALTYASRYGSREVVEALARRGAKEGGGDDGAALRQALRNKNKSAARALLRAGFGAAPPGTFALESAASEEDCTLAAPSIHPKGGAFAKTQKVSLMIGDKDAANAGNNMGVLYTLDGRDPYLAGQRYIGPFSVAGCRTLLRAVAVQFAPGKSSEAKARSQLVEAEFVICHCVLPDEIVSGAITACLFPGAANRLKKHTAVALDMPEDRLQVSVSEAGADKEGRWIEARLNDLKPRHRIHFGMAFATIKQDSKRKKWIDSICKDIDKAIGTSPEDCKVFAGSIILEFEMARDKAEELAEQLADSSSYLCTKARNRKAFKSCSLQVVDALGSRLSEVSFRDQMEEALKSKSGRPKILSLGEGDEGSVACYVKDKKEARAMKKKMDSVIKSKLEDIESAETKDYLEDMVLDFAIDVMESGQGSSIVKALDDSATIQKISDDMAILEGIDTVVRVATPASTRKLAELEFVVSWGETFEELLDCTCFAYAEENLATIVNFQLSSPPDENDSEAKTKDQLHQLDLSRSINRALSVPEDDGSDQMPKDAKLKIDLSALPSEVTDLYFMVASPEARLSSAGPLSFTVKDVVRDNALSTYNFVGGDLKAAIVCNLSRYGSGWVVHTLHMAADAAADNLEPTLRILEDRQGHHMNWERRRDLVRLRALHKSGRMNPDSRSETAMLMQMVMDLPVAVFQLLVKMF
eukprot:TRINITY_DN3863_c0_g1_i1.p1 TRINITY_DN3863_c0_g1~~TRINITY_DN3863_c0_g1_i1.p1  ORF type:complete len:1082 (-),score=256.16 TRINITY_DN3863_c0_g1_i1:65-3310(-)